MNEYDTGLDTTPGMWEMVSEILEGEQLPTPLSNAINLLASGKAKVIEVNEVT